MDIEKLLNDFIDGNLDPSHEETLFMNLVSNEDMRRDLKQHIKLKGLISNDKQAFTPQPDSLNLIGSKLGFSGFPPVETLKPSFFSKYKQGILSSATTAIAAILFYFLLPNDLLISNRSDGNINNMQSAFVKNENVNEKEVTNSSDSKNTIIVNDTVYVDRIKEVPVLISQDNFVDSETSSKESTYIVYNQKVQSPINKSIRYNSENVVVPDNQYNSFYSTPLINSSSIALNVEGFYNNFYNGAERNLNKNFQSLNNASLSILYNLSDRVSIGMDYSRENFYQSFISSLNDNAIRYFQNPDYQVFSIISRYDIDHLDLGPLNSYLQASIGVPLSERNTISGLVTRLGIGYQYDINGYWYFNTIFDYNLMSYNQNKINYISNKFGIRAGIGLRIR